MLISQEPDHDYPESEGEPFIEEAIPDSVNHMEEELVFHLKDDDPTLPESIQNVFLKFVDGRTKPEPR